MRKAAVRKQVLALRCRLDPLTYLQLSGEIQQRLLQSDCFLSAKRLALYSPIRNEVATEQIFMAALRAGKRVFYPRVSGEDLVFAAVSHLDQFVTGAFGVAEPISDHCVGTADLDLIVVPGVAFSAPGFRLGYGRGYYDRKLESKSSETASLGLAFDLQLCDLLPIEEHDQRLDFIVTETKFISCAKRGVNINSAKRGS
jgi:5-formyltetrahydrofolate cyclo-ligase